MRKTKTKKLVFFAFLVLLGSLGVGLSADPIVRLHNQWDGNWVCRFTNVTISEIYACYESAMIKVDDDTQGIWAYFDLSTVQGKAEYSAALLAYSFDQRVNIVYWENQAPKDRIFEGQTTNKLMSIYFMR